MTEIMEFINARIDERETQWRDLLAQAQRVTLALQGPALLGKVIPGGGWYYWPKIESLAAEALREVELTRRLIELHKPQIWCGSATCMTCMQNYPPFERHDWPCETIRVIAWRWSDHPDYGRDWLPDTAPDRGSA